MKDYSYAIDPTHLEKLDMNEIAKLVKYDDLYSNASKEQDKTKYLILMYEIMRWELYFPYSAYRLIIADLMHWLIFMKIGYLHNLEIYSCCSY